MLAPSFGRAPRFYVSCAIGLVSVLCLVASTWPVTPLAERAGFAEAARAAAETGGFVVVWPATQASALEKLPKEVQAADAVPVEAPGDRSFATIAVLMPRGATPPPELDDSEPASRKTYGDVDLATYRFADAHPGFDLRKGLARAEVHLGEKPCDVPAPGGGVRCGGFPEWNHVTPEVITVQARPWRCVWAHPSTGLPLVIRLADVALGSDLVLEAALDDRVAAGGAPVSFRLEVSGLPPRTLQLDPARGVRSLRVPTPKGEHRAITLTVETPDDGRRHVGVNLRAEGS